MKVLYLIITGLIIYGQGFSQQFYENEVRQEIEEMNRQEQMAFKNGDCEMLVSLMSDDIQFYANGRNAPSKQVIQ